MTSRRFFMVAGLDHPPIRSKKNRHDLPGREGMAVLVIQAIADR
jgi:hypothetical protein